VSTMGGFSGMVFGSKERVGEPYQDSASHIGPGSEVTFGTYLAKKMLGATIGVTPVSA
jgi:hypothetical protein